MRQLNVWGGLGIWAFICLGGGIYASWEGYGGRGFTATLTAFALLLLVMLLFAAKGVSENLARSMGPTAGFLLGACLFLTYIAYLLGTGTFAFARAGVVAGLVFVPLGLASSAAKAAAGAWQDFVILAGVWVFVKFSPSHWLWPYPGGRLAYVFTVLAAVGVALATFVLVRHWLLLGVGPQLGTLRSGKLPTVRLHRHSFGTEDAFHRVRAAMGALEFVPRIVTRDFVFHRLARRILVSRVVAELPIQGIEERPCRMVDRLCSLRFLPYHQYGLSQLALCDSRLARRPFLRMDLEEDRFHLCFRLGARRRRCNLALPVS
jgi:hypothetical protein